MNALYPKLRALPSIFIICFLLAGCEQSPPNSTTEAWPNEHEVIFQEAEALKYSLEKNKLETQQLNDIQVPPNPPLPMR